MSNATKRKAENEKILQKEANTCKRITSFFSKAGVRLYSMLRGSKPPATEFLSTFCVVSPHSMTVERSVSTYNMLFSDLRTSTSDTTLIGRLLIHWNGVATALYDPRPAVQNFMLRKDQRMKLPVTSTYTERDFIKKFFE
ncbi:Hypothetical predicted protein [Paramuricea clavata]|uniref:Uncharacterized protein n=1 Tax=Paramuricea clavata TaxID=317549 RepID=A0A6S7KLQ1_PARCT|nr:Hypothetical predicted protein [Paramuricea clavata]